MGTEEGIIRANAFFGVGIGHILSPALIICIAFVWYIFMGGTIITALIIGMITSIIMGCYSVIKAFNIRRKMLNLNQESKK